MHRHATSLNLLSLLTPIERKQAALLVLATIIFVGAARIPLPGAPVAAIGNSHAVAGSKLFEFSFLVWFGTIAAAEFLRLLFPRTFPIALQHRGHVDPHSRGIIIISMALIAARAVHQITQIESALQAADYTFTPFAPVLYTVSAVAGLAVLLTLGKWIERSTVDHSFWFIAFAFYILWWNSFIPIMLAELDTGMTTKPLLLMSAAGLVSNIVLLAVAVLPSSMSDSRAAERFIWPWFIGMAGGPYVVDLVANLDLFDANHLIQQNRSMADTVANAAIVLSASVLAFRGNLNWNEVARILLFYCLFFLSQEVMRRYNVSWLQVDGFLLVLLLWASTALGSRVRQELESLRSLPRLR